MEPSINVGSVNGWVFGWTDEWAGAFPQRVFALSKICFQLMLMASLPVLR